MHTCVGKSRTRGRPDTRRDRKEISQPRESSRPGSLLCVAQTTPGRARGRWAGQHRGRIQCACGGGGRPAPHACTRVEWGVPLGTPGTVGAGGSARALATGRAGVRWNPGMARSHLASLPTLLALLGLVSPTQINPDYQYFGQQGESDDTWELLRLQRQKGKLAGGRA